MDIRKRYYLLVFAHYLVVAGIMNYFDHVFILYYLIIQISSKILAQKKPTNFPSFFNDFYPAVYLEILFERQSSKNTIQPGFD